MGEGEVGVLMPQPEGATDGWTAAVRLRRARRRDDGGGAASAPGLVPTEWVDLATPMETLAPFEAAGGRADSGGGAPRGLLPPRALGWSEVMLATGGRGCARPPPRPPCPPRPPPSAGPRPRESRRARDGGAPSDRCAPAGTNWDCSSASLSRSWGSPRRAGTRASLLTGRRRLLSAWRAPRQHDG